MERKFVKEVTRYYPDGKIKVTYAEIGNYAIEERVCTFYESDNDRESISIMPKDKSLLNIWWDDRSEKFIIQTPTIVNDDYKTIKPQFDEYVRVMTEALETAEVIERYYGKENV